MPKAKALNVCRLRSYIEQFGEVIFSTNRSVLFCKKIVRKEWQPKKSLL